MSKEALYSTDKRCIFRETFNSEQDVRKNSGEPIDVTFSNGRVTSSLATSNIRYPSPFLTNDYTVRYRTKFLGEYFHGVFTGGILGATAYSDGFYFGVDNRTGNERMFIISNGGGLNSGTLSLSIELDKEYVFTYSISETDNFIKYYLDDTLIGSGTYSSITQLKKGRVDLLSRQYYGTTISANVDMDLFELYNAALSGEEIYNMNHNLTNKDTTKGMELNIDARGGVIEDRFNDVEITNSNVEVKKDTVNSMWFNGTSSQLDFPFIHSGVCTITAWVKNYKVGIMYIVDFRRNGGNGYIFISSERLGSLVGATFYVNGKVTNVIPNGEWVFVAVTMPVGALSNTLVIGNRALATYQWHEGFINELRFYDRTLTPNEITQLSTSQQHNYE